METRFLGIEIGGTKLQIVVGDEQAGIVERQRFTVAPAAGGPGIRARIEEVLPALCHAAAAAAVGVGFGGPVDWTTGRICCSHQIEGWADFPLRDWMQQLVRLPVGVDNDANTAALGEAARGAGVGFNPVFYVTLGSGVGGGLVVEGRIYHGATPGEAEIGHVRLDRHGANVESRCSGWAVDARIRRLKETAPDSRLARMLDPTPGGEARHLRAALEQGDPAAERLLRATAEDLAFGLSHVVHLFHPGVIVVGGGLSLLGEPLRAAVARALPAFVMEAFHPPPRVVLAGLGEDAVPVGALLLARGAWQRAQAAS